MEKEESKITICYDHARKTCKALEKAIDKLSTEQDQLDNETKEMYFDSIIQRFELAYETFWKYLKEYISIHHGLELASPRSTFRQCFKLNIISKQEAEELDDTSDARNITTQEAEELDDTSNARNITTHLYNQKMSRNMVKNLIPKYCILFKKILTRLAP